MKIKNLNVLITGGAKRIGREVALCLAQKGANLAINYKSSKESAERVVAEIEGIGRKAVAVQGDVSRAEDARRLVDTVVAEFGSIDVLVNNAAIFPKTPYDKITEKDWDTVLRVNTKGPFLCSFYASKHMRAQKKGKIINMADWAAMRPYKDYLPYLVSKAGVIALTKALAVELAPHIQVNAVAPGPILLPEDMREEEKQKVREATLLGRIGSPQDIANTIAFLIEGSDFITGAVIPVDGGRLLGKG